MDFPTTLDRETAQRFLMRAGVSSGTLPYAQLREALAIVAQYCDYQIFGVCAGDAATGIRSLHAYATALGYAAPPALTEIPGAVYIKYNPNLPQCYLETYEGRDRGVLVSCQSAYDHGIRDLYGHLPLDLFDH